MLKVGLTGGIGSGKSEVARLFAKLGAAVIDADEIARQLVEPGSPALAEIIRLFGAGCVDDDGRLNRAALAKIVFNDATRRQQLDAIMHPRVRARIEQDILACARQPYAIIVVPLLLEANQTDLVDRVLVILAPETTRLQRVIDRDAREPDQILAIMQSQAPDEVRQHAADDIIRNTGDLDTLASAVEQLHRNYTNIGSEG
jgi:dephospho-CoA kinase